MSEKLDLTRLGHANKDALICYWLRVSKNVRDDERQR